jgi:ATP-dependent DNA helicase PIF1
MDAAVLDFDRIFAAGQAYVGMSRVVDFDKLFIKNFDATKIKASPKVLQYYRSIMENLPADDSMEA